MHALLISSAHPSETACNAFQAHANTDAPTEIVIYQNCQFVEAPAPHLLSAQPPEIAPFVYQALANTGVTIVSCAMFQLCHSVETHALLQLSAPTLETATCASLVPASTDVRTEIVMNQSYQFVTVHAHLQLSAPTLETATSVSLVTASTDVLTVIVIYPKP